MNAQMRLMEKMVSICHKGRLDVLKRGYHDKLDKLSLVVRIYEFTERNNDACFLSIRFRDAVDIHGDSVDKRPMTALTQPCSNFSFMEQDWSAIGEIAWAGLAVPATDYLETYASQLDEGTKSGVCFTQQSMDAMQFAMFDVTPVITSLAGQTSSTSD